MSTNDTQITKTEKLAPELETRAKKILASVAKVPVATQAERVKAAAILVEIKKEIKAIEEQRDEVAKPAYEAYKKMRLKAKPILDPLEQAEVALKARIAKGIEDEEKATALALAEAMAAGGSQEAVTAIVAAAPDKLQGVSTRKIRRYRVLDMAKIPEKYKMVNHSAVQLAMKDEPEAEIPGIEFYDETCVSASTR